jgi:2-oxo-4-hydroxy-4-carboxy--5-ureidoimidazoline (OHCU) decarboxylase
VSLDRARLTVLFEGAPRFLDRLVAAGPFPDDDALFEAARTIAHAMPEDERTELIDAHPRLGAPHGSVSSLSFIEQGYDRDAAAARTEDQRTAIDAEIARLNDAYEERFGFRYCVFVAGRPRHELVAPFRAALEADRDAELRRAIDAVIDIAMDRHATLSAEVTR